MTSLSSKSSLGTPHHHQSLRGKQLENPTSQLGSSRAPRVLLPFGRESGGTIACAFQHCGERILRTDLTLIRCVVFVSCTNGLFVLAIAPSGLSLSYLFVE